MKKYQDKEDNIIDVFYKEDSDKVDELDISKEFSEKLIKASESLEVLENENFELDINTMDIINKAEIIQDKSSSRREIILFTILSTVILSTYFSLALLYSPNIIILSQVIIFIIATTLIIPLSIGKRRGAK